MIWQYIFVLEMLEKFQFAVCTLCQYRGGERLHDLLDGHGLPSKLVLSRTARVVSMYLRQPWDPDR